MKRYPAEILATCVVPWRIDDRFDEELFREQVRFLREGLTRRLYVFGTAGEGYAVSDRQFEQIVSAFRSEMSGADDHPMIGIISLSLSTVVERIEFCRGLGLRDFQISLPSWGTLTDREVDLFFAATCGQFADCRFLHYNLPRAGRVLQGVDYARLSAAHANLVAVKYGGNDDAARLEMLRQAPLLQFFFTEPGYATTRDQFECGLLLSTAMANFAMARNFFEARGEHLQELWLELKQIGEALHRAVASSGHMDGAFDKLLIKLHLPHFPLRLLPPYTAATDECITQFLHELPPRWRRAVTI